MRLLYRSVCKAMIFRIIITKMPKIKSLLENSEVFNDLLSK